MPITSEMLKRDLAIRLGAACAGGAPDPGKLQELAEQLCSEHAKLVEQHVNSSASADRTKLLLAEVENNDWFTRRARPGVVYAGLIFIFLLHVALPVAAFVLGNPAPTAALPEEFWWSWSSVVSVWVLGRSYEKVNVPSALSKAITGAN